MSTIAVIPARKGSKRIPFKNRRYLSGQPLLDYTVNAALDTPEIDEIYLSTDDKELLDTVKNKQVKKLVRDPSLATDMANSFDVMINTVNQLEENGHNRVEFLVMLQITTPLRDKGLISKGIQMLKENHEASCLISVYLQQKFTGTIHDSFWEPDYPANPPARSQDMEKKYIPSGSLYIYRYDKSLRNGLGWGPKILPLIVDANKWVNIDYEEDFTKAEYLLETYQADFSHLIKS